MNYNQVLDDISEAMNFLEGKGERAKSNRYVYHVGEELCEDDTGDKYDEIVIRYDTNEFLNTNGCGLYATIASRFANKDITVSLAGTVCSALITTKDIVKSMAFRLSKGEDE